MVLPSVCQSPRSTFHNQINSVIAFANTKCCWKTINTTWLDWRNSIGISFRKLSTFFNIAFYILVYLSKSILHLRFNHTGSMFSLFNNCKTSIYLCVNVIFFMLNTSTHCFVLNIFYCLPSCHYILVWGSHIEMFLWYASLLIASCIVV